ncbi:MAG: hypothetical protein ABIU29_03095 [Chthoniobacterales bacterium]
MAAPFRQRGPMERSNSRRPPFGAGPRWFVISLALCLLHGTVAARIGETEAQVNARYSNPIFNLPSQQNTVTKCYVSGVFSIAVTYVDGKSVREMVAKADKSKITEKEINRLLEANAGGSAWNAQQLAGEKNVPDGLLGWRTDAEKPRVALYDERTQAFFVTTQKFINQTNATSRRAAAKNLNSKSPLAGAQGERMLRSFQNGKLLGGRALPTSSPARKAEAGK